MDRAKKFLEAFDPTGRPFTSPGSMVVGFLSDSWNPFRTSTSARNGSSLIPSPAMVTCEPAAATLGQGLLPGIAVTIGIIASAQILVVAGAGGWYPAATPALWAMDPPSVSTVQLGLVVLVTTAFGIATTQPWIRLQLDRST